MTATASAAAVRGWPLDDPRLSVLAVGTSKDPNAKISVLLFRAGDAAPACCCKIPTTDTAEEALQAEARALQALHGRDLGGLEQTVPRVLAEPHVGGRRALALTGMPGTPMARGYNLWGHTADRAAVGSEFTAARRWLLQLWAATEQGCRSLDLVSGLVPGLETRFREHPRRRAVLRGLQPIGERLRGVSGPATAVHGDFWFGNLLWDGSRVTAVLDWESAAVCGQPVRDLLRFALSYALYLDRHTRPGRRVGGHPGLRAGVFGAGIEYGIGGSGWFPDLFREFLGQGLGDLGLDPQLWPDLALAAVAEAAATADDPRFAAAHLELFARLSRAG